MPASPAAACRPPPAAALEPNTQIKLVPELKPSVLPHDASDGELHIWIKKYEAYYTAFGMQHARTAVQHAYLLNCLDSTLALKLDGSISAQTSVLGANLWMSKLLEMFRKNILSCSEGIFFPNDPADGPGRSRFPRATYVCSFGSWHIGDDFRRHAVSYSPQQSTRCQTEGKIE